jgi:hypothetical protein
MVPQTFQIVVLFGELEREFTRFSGRSLVGKDWRAIDHRALAFAKPFLIRIYDGERRSKGEVMLHTIPAKQEGMGRHQASKRKL